MIKNLFSKILSAAIVELSPGAQIDRAGLSYHGFYCDFFCYSPLSGELLERLEERMRQIIREDREVRILEMVPFSASEMLKKFGQKERARQLLQLDGLVRIFQMEGFADLLEEGGCPRSTGGSSAFRLLSQVELGRNHLRVFGVAADSKKELKDLLSRWEQFEEKDHEKVGSDLGLWCLREEDGHRLWLPGGIAARDRLIAFWREAFAPIAEPVEGGGAALELLAEKIPSSIELIKGEGEGGSRGLLDHPCSSALSLNHFLDLPSFCISFLQTIHKSLTILGFTYRIRCFGKRRKGCFLRGSLEKLGWIWQEDGSDAEPGLEVLVEDSLRCEWALAEIGELKLKGRRGLFAMVWVERNLALLIERSDGNMPFWLAPEHLRVIPVSEGQEEAARIEADAFREQGFRVVWEKVSGRTLSERLRGAERAKVPFVAILGEKEARQSLLAWRGSGMNQETGSREQLSRLLRMRAGELIENK